MLGSPACTTLGQRGGGDGDATMVCQSRQNPLLIGVDGIDAGKEKEKVVGDSE